MLEGPFRNRTESRRSPMLPKMEQHKYEEIMTILFVSRNGKSRSKN